MKFFEALGNVFRIPDLRKRVLFTLAMLAVYRLGGHIPTPGVNVDRWQEFLSRNSGGIFGFFDLFAGGNIRRFTVFALGIMPYITASIILQLLTVVVPTLEKLQKEGELGRRKITQWTRYLTIALSIIQSFGIAQGLQHSNGKHQQRREPGTTPTSQTADVPSLNSLAAQLTRSIPFQATGFHPGHGRRCWGALYCRVQVPICPAVTYQLSQPPSGMTIDSYTGLITWTPTADQTPTEQVTVHATDLAENTANSNSRSTSWRPIRIPVLTPASPSMGTTHEDTAITINLSSSSTMVRDDDHYRRGTGAVIGGIA